MLLNKKNTYNLSHSSFVLFGYVSYFHEDYLEELTLFNNDSYLKLNMVKHLRYHHVLWSIWEFQLEFNTSKKRSLLMYYKLKLQEKKKNRALLWILVFCHILFTQFCKSTAVPKRCISLPREIKNTYKSVTFSHLVLNL